MKLGIEKILENSSLRRPLHGKRIALLGHPASVTQSMQHSLDALCACPELDMRCAMGPQHGMRGDKQDNMVESEDFVDPRHGIPVFSLYGHTRRPTDAMMDGFDVLLCDVQDIGCRIYTYITTLLYVLQACAQSQKVVWVLDRPNPAGRAMEGSILKSGWTSFVGAGPILMRHGLTMAEMAKWFIRQADLQVDLTVVPMDGYDPHAGPGFGWPEGMAWVNPSPNASSVNMARIFAGSVLFEGTQLSEGRGTTNALELVGAPDIDMDQLLRDMHKLAPHWMQGALLRACYFEPTFHKHQGTLCRGFQVHTDVNRYDPKAFKPYRLMALLLKALRLRYPDYELWRKHAYEYEFDRLPIDLIDGGPALREWVDDSEGKVGDFDEQLVADEFAWGLDVRESLIY